MTVNSAPIAAPQKPKKAQEGPAPRQGSDEATTTTGMAALLRREMDRLDSAIRDGTTATLHTASDELRLQAHLGLLDAQDRLGILESFGRGLATRMKDTLETAADVGALQLALANMDLEDAVEERQKRAEKEFHLASDAARKAVSDLWREFEPRFRAFVKDVAKYV